MCCHEWQCRTNSGSAIIRRFITKTRVALTVFLLVATVFAAAPAAAQVCTFTNTGVNFGNVDLSSGNRVRTTGTFSITCNGIPGRRVRVCMNFGSGTGGLAAPSADPRYMRNGANRLNYNMFKRNNYTRIWGSLVWPYPPRALQRRVRLNGAGVGTRNVPIRTEIYANQTSVPPGFYNSIFSGGHTLISYAYTNVGNCRTISALGGVQVPFTVQANVLGACTVATTNLNFGTTGILSSNQDATNTISVRCANLTPYSISLDGGLSGAADPTLRKMTSGPDEVTYGIYQNAARTIPWGDTIGTNTVGGTGNGGTQNFTAYGRTPVQTTPASGTYTDTIVATISY